MIKILFLAADPINEVRLLLTEEHDRIKEELFRAQSSGFIMEARMATRPSDMIRAIHDINPDIVHFSGHGTTKGELCFLNNNNESEPIPPDALATLFKLISDRVECVVLNACYADSQAKIIAQYIDYVIGMKNRISDDAAILFSVGFYRALCVGNSYDKAFDFGKLEIQMNSFSESEIPKLIKKEKSVEIISLSPGEPEFPDGELSEKINDILAKMAVGLNSHYKTAQFVGSYQVFTCKEDNTDLAFVELKGLDKDPLVIKVLAEKVKSYYQSLDDAWKSILLLERFNSPKALDYITPLFEISLTGAEKNNKKYDCFIERVFSYLGRFTDRVYREKIKKIYYAGSLTCNLTKARIKCLDKAMEYSQIDDVNIIEHLAKVADTDSDSKVKIKALTYLGQTNFQSQGLPIMDWLKVRDIQIRSNVSSSLLPRVAHLVNYKELNELFTLESNNPIKVNLWKVLYRINSKSAIMAIRSIFATSNDVELLRSFINVCIQMRISEVSEQLEKILKKQNFPELHSLINKYLQVIEK